MLRSLRPFRLLLPLLLLGGPAPALLHAQTLPTAPSAAPADTLHKYERPATGPLATAKKPLYKGKLVRASIVPAVLIAYGASTINGHGFYSSYDAKNDVRYTFGTYRNHLDDFLQWAPYLEIPAVLLAGVESHDDRLNLALVVLKSEAIMLTSVYIVKELSHIQRPDSSDYRSFPSGHTAQAFLAASIVHAEFRDKSQWYGIGAYTLATGVAALRMINNKHWQSDVIAGAGFGILSAHLAYLSHRSRWGHKATGRGIGDMSVMPSWSPAGGGGLSVSWRPK
jgi:membrane-associated phospholipid phosphatase